MKYWEIIADRLHAQRWSYGIAEHFTKHGFLVLGHRYFTDDALNLCAGSRKKHGSSLQ